MKIQRAFLLNEMLARIVFLIVPCILPAWYLLQQANSYYSILQDRSAEQTLYFAAGILGAGIFYAFPFRFITTFALLAAALYSVYLGLDKTAVGEFDTFFISVRFMVAAILFSCAWVIGAGFARWRYMHFAVATVVLLCGIFLPAKTQTDSVQSLLGAFLPSIAFAAYIIFAGEQIYNYRERSMKFWWFMIRRLVVFALFIGLTGGVLYYAMRGKFEAAVADAGGQGKDGDERGMLKKDKNGNFDLKDYSRLKSNQGRSNELLFAAHINNFFPDSDIPNPLYLTAFYYTKFDTATETFERDKSIPKNDLFEPDPSAISMYQTKVDSSVIKNSMGNKARKVVEIEVYSKSLSPTTYLAPNIGFFVQPIAIEKDYRDQFKTAFRAKGYVSELNSAYFIYNAKDPQIKQFQEQRFAVLRTAPNYDTVDKKFMAYYTYMPRDAKFAQIGTLSRQITAGSKTTVDKVLAIRDYFLSKDEDGNARFTYTDNPGVPDIPSASKLMYFLFENRKGYCAYYAGATLFMLRSLGIPSRITVGFLTVDRSDKNKGWYWYYADQAHAWVQVYFPGFGWLDFDTTVGNDEAEQSPKPDGTPPMQPPHAWFAAEGVVESVDTLQKTIRLRTWSLLFHDQAHKSEKAQGTSVLLDVSIATIQKDSVNVMPAQVRPGDSATAVSYAEVLKNLPAGNAAANAEIIIQSLPKSVPTDDVYIKLTPKEQKEQAQKAAAAKPQGRSWRDKLIFSGLLLLVCALLFFALPTFVFMYYKLRARTAKKQAPRAYWQYRTLMFYFNQLGFFRGGQTPLHYASQTLDAQYHLGFADFVQDYLHLKYAGEAPRSAAFPPEQHKKIIANLRKQISSKERISAFLKPMRSIKFFTGDER